MADDKDLTPQETPTDDTKQAEIDALSKKIAEMPEGEPEPANAPEKPADEKAEAEETPAETKSEPAEKEDEKPVKAEAAPKKKEKKPSEPMTKKQKQFFAIAGAILVVLVIAVGAGIAALRSNDNSVTPTDTPATPTPTPTPVTRASLVDGVEVANDLAIKHPLAIMIENHPEARPQSGLGSASIVYEAITEGGITRFMGIFQHKLPEKAGPVRSARTVFVDLIKEFGPVSAYYAHVGGAADALDQLRREGLYDMDQSAIGSKAFQRFPRAGIATEHTMFTFPSKLFDIAKERKYKEESSFTSWKFKTDATADVRPETQNITIPFSSASYEVKYVYDKATNTYKRFMGGTEHKDALTGTQLAPKNVVVQFATYETVKSAGKEVQKIGIVGEGNARVFRDGKMIEAKWKRSGTNRTTYTDAATGAEIEFNRGQTFVEIPKIGTNITVQ